MALFGKKCFVCTKKSGVSGVKHLSYLRNQEVLPVPQGMTEKDVMCKDCYFKRNMDGSDKWFAYWMSIYNPLTLYNNLHAAHDEWVMSVYNKYIKEHPDFFQRCPDVLEFYESLNLIESQIESLQKQFNSTKGKMNYNKGYNFVNNPSMKDKVFRDMASAPYEQMLITLDGEIKQLQIQKSDISNKLSRCSFNSISSQTSTSSSSSAPSPIKDSHSPFSSTGSPIKTSDISTEKRVEIAPLMVKGLDLTNLGDYDDAIKNFDEILEIDPKNADAWSSKGHAFSRLGNYDEARKCFDEALEINPKDAYLINYRSKLIALIEHLEQVKTDDSNNEIDNVQSEIDKLRQESENDFKEMKELTKNLSEGMKHLSKKNSTNDDPIKILKLRLAKGEITQEEFNEIKESLED